MVLRPDGARFDHRGDVRATVSQVRFAGTRLDVTVTPERGPDLVVNTDPALAPTVGDQLTLAFDAQAFLVYRDPAD